MENDIKVYSIEEALKLVKENAKAKFDESVEVHVKLAPKSKKDELSVRGVCVLRHGIGKTKRVAVFTENDIKKQEAQEAGADLVGGKELITQIKSTGKTDFDVALATPDIMRDLAPIAKVLGPRGLMPSPKTETIVENVSKSVKELKAGKVEFKSDKSGNIHQVIGKVSFDENKLRENLDAFIVAFKKVIPEKAKSGAVKNTVLCSTMGRSVRVKI